MAPKDSKLYDLLGLSPESSQTDIKSALLKKIKLLSLNRNTTVDADEMQGLVGTRNISLDPNLKAIYDSQGLATVISSISSKREYKKSRENRILRDRANLSYKNVCLDHNLTLVDMYLGVEQTVSYNVRDFCPNCFYKTDLEPRLCSLCDGEPNYISSGCLTCRGKGRLSCFECYDTKFIKNLRKTTFKVFNAEDEERVIKESLGNELVKGRSDLVIFIEIQPDPKFWKFNNDIIMKMELTRSEAKNGFEKVFKYIDNLHYKLICKDDVIYDNDFRVVKGLGFKLKQSDLRGNLIIIFNINVLSEFLDFVLKPYFISAITWVLNKNKNRQADQTVIMMPVTPSY